MLYLPRGGRALFTYGGGPSDPGVPSDPEDAGGPHGPSGTGAVDESRSPAGGDPDRDASVGAALQALAVALRRGAVTFTVETVDARPATASPIAARLREAGFAAVPRGFRWRG